MFDTIFEFGAYLRRVREAQGLTLDALAARTGISKPYLSNIETARAKRPASDGKLTLLEQALGLPAGELVQAAAWLRTPDAVRALVKSEAPRRADGTIDLDRLAGGRRKKPAAAPEVPGALPTRAIPLINRVAAGKAAEFGDLDYPVGVADAYVRVPEEAEDQEARASLALKVTGDSMMPEYREGDVIVVAAGDPKDGEDCLVRLDESENFATTFKRVYFVPADEKTGAEAGARGAEGPTHVRLVPLNPRHAERVVAMEHVTGLYPVVWKMTAVRRGAGRER